MSNFAQPISDIQRAYLSRATDFVKTSRNNIGYAKLGRELTGTGANINATTLMRWHKASEGIGKEPEKVEGVKVVPHPSNLTVLAMALPEADEPDANAIELAYLKVLESFDINPKDYSSYSAIEPEIARKIGYKLPINRQVFLYVFDLNLGDSRKFPDQITHLADRVNELEEYQLKIENELRELNNKISGIRDLLVSFQDKNKANLSSVYANSGVDLLGTSSDVIARIEALELTVSKIQGETKLGNNASGIELTKVLQNLTEAQSAFFNELSAVINANSIAEDVDSEPEKEKYSVAHPLDLVRQIIDNAGLELEEIAEFSGASLENIRLLLSGEFDEVLSNDNLPLAKKFKAEATLNTLISGLNILTGSTLSQSEVMIAYTKI